MKIKIYNALNKILYLCIMLFFLYACKDKVNGPTDPCIDCPIDFRVTDFEPAWSPDGNTIAYVHGDTIPGKTGIYLINLDGTNKRLWHSSASAYAPSWSPDGEWIIFSDQSQIFKMKVNGDSLTQLTFEGRNFFPDWSPNGQWITFDSNNDSPNGMNFIWIMKSDGSDKERIAYDPSSGEIRMPNWSPDGNKIVHQKYIGIGSPEIFTMDSFGNNAIRLTYNEKFDSYPRYSPNGNLIAFTSYPQGLASQTQIWVMDTSGSNLNQLTTTQGYTCDWSPDGEWIVYTDSRAVSGRLWIMRKDGSDKQQLTFY
jgi:Tol biopolymer transport system component